MRKIITGSVHALAIILLMVSIAMLTFSSSGGNALLYIRQAQYVESSGFNSQLGESVSDIFDYIDYQELFEKNGALDLNHVIAQAETNGVLTSYSLDYLIRYARSMGYYLNDKYEIADDGAATVTKQQDDSNQVRVKFRAYMPDYQPSSPADGLMTLGQLSQETLGYLSKYYAIRSEFYDKPSNFKYTVRYSLGDKQVIYSNASGLTNDDIQAMGRHYFTDGATAQVNTNLKEVPANVIPLLEAKNPYVNGDYSLAFGVDTDFPNDDIYKRTANAYESRRVNSVVGLILLALSLVIAAISGSMLIAFTGIEKDDKKIHLQRVDKIPVEVRVLVFLVWILVVNIVTPNFFESISLIVGHVEHTSFWQNTLSILLKYMLLVPTCLSLIRSYKKEEVWKTSLIRVAFNFIGDYITKASQAFPKIVTYVLFIIPNLGALALVAILFYHFFAMHSLRAFVTAIAILLIMTVIDYYTYRIATGLSRAVDEQVRSERLKADLITNVSHDLKTPLTSIINYVDLMKREDIDNPRVQEYLRVLDQKSTRLKTLTEDLVEASKASSGNVNMEFATLDYSEIVMQALGEFEDKFEIRKLEIIEQFPEKPVMIEADGRSLWRVIENLLNNCCKYALKGSRVYVSVEEDEETCRFVIKNISETALNVTPEELTERFVRGDVSRTTEGSGLGLSIAKSLTTLMHGKLEITIDGDLYKASVIFPRRTEDETE